MNDDKPIDRDSPLGRALDDYPVPQMASGFADQVVAGTNNRPAPLPELRSGNARSNRWRSLRRFGIVTLGAGAMATAAAATGLLDDLPIPSPREVWNSITGQSPEPEPLPKAATRPEAVESAPATRVLEEETVKIEGPIDTPEELEEAFRRVDDFRANRKATRRSNVDRVIDKRIERRREQGLPAPNAEQEERLRNRIDRFRERRDAQSEQRIQERRDALRERIENGEELSREGFLREQRGGASADEEIRQRFQRLRNLPPEERRRRIRRFMERQEPQQSAPETEQQSESEPESQSDQD